MFTVRVICLVVFLGWPGSGHHRGHAIEVKHIAVEVGHGDTTLQTSCNVPILLLMVQRWELVTIPCSEIF
jgi:hypothetical protein